MDLDGFSAAIGYRFNRSELLTRALTHRSYGAEHNERLEFLGDSVVNCAVALELYRKFPGLTEGELSRRRRVLDVISGSAKASSRAAARSARRCWPMRWKR